MAKLVGQRGASTTYFSTIQVLRGVAALLVVLYHLVDAERIYGRGPMLLDGVARLGFAGVDVFFVISGFVMTTIAAGKFASRMNAVTFLYRRAVRILPLYWLFTAVIVVVMVAVPHALDASYRDKSVVASFLLWPQAGLPLLQVGWTLIYEAFFYVMMAFSIAFISESRVPIFLFVWALCVFALQFVPLARPWQVVIASPMAWEFILGGMVGLSWREFPSGAARPVFWLGSVGFIAGALLLNHFGLVEQSPLRRTLVFGSCAALIVLGLVLHERAGQTSPHRWLLRMGNASYSIYLSHLFVVTLAARLWGRLGTNQSLMGHACFITVTLVACVGAGIVCFYLVERPLLQLYEGMARGRTIIKPGTA